MTNPNRTAIAVILDRSGSMQICRSDTIGGFNAFLEEQKKLPGYATLSLIQFDDQYETVYRNRELKEVAPLNEHTYTPRGGTALHDAIGRTINDLGAQLAQIPEVDRPGKVVVVIITDGEENQSKEFRGSHIKEMIERQRATYQWEFVYLGANQDAVTVGASMGIAKGMSASYNVRSMGGVFRMASDNISGYRTATGPDAGAQLSFSADQRATLIEPNQK